MNKIFLKESAPKTTIINFEGQDIEVVPYINSQMQEGLIEVYFTAYFADGKEDRLNAEKVNRMAVLDLLTNINIELETNKLVDMLDSVVYSGLWDKIEKAIRNYREYTYNLSVALESRKKQNSDVGFILQKFLDEKISPLVDKFGDMDLTEIKGIVADLGKQLDPSTPVGSLIIKGVV